MKYFKTTILLIFLISCNKENPNSLANLNKSLSVESFREFIPENKFTDLQKIYFINSYGELKDIYLINSGQEFYQRKRDDFEFETQTVFYSFSEKPTSDYELIISLSSNYDSDFDPVYTLFVQNFTSSNSDINPAITLELEENWGTFEFFKEYSLNGRKFFDVYKSKIPFAVESYSVVYYTKKDGIIGFDDQNQTLWVMNEFVY